MRPVLVEVEWKDACTNGNWGALRDGAPSLATVWTTGWLLRQGRRRLSVVGSRSADGTGFGFVSIPRDAIVAVRPLRRGRRWTTW